MSSKNRKHKPLGSNMTQSQTALGQYILNHRIKLDLNQSELAELAGVSQGRISNIEIGTSKYLRDREIVKLNDALKCDEEEFRELLIERPKKLDYGPPTTKLSKLISSIRIDAGLSIQEFAEKVGVSESTAIRLNTDAALIIYKTAIKLVEVFKLKPKTFTKYFQTYGSKVIDDALGKKIRKRRQELGMSLSDLGGKLNVTRQRVSQFEMGRSLGKKTIEKISVVLDCRLKAKPRKLKQKNIDPSTLGGFFTKIRLERNLTLKQSAVLSGLGVSEIGNIENNKAWTLSGLQQLARAYKVVVPVELLPKGNKSVPRSRYGSSSKSIRRISNQI